MNMKRLALLGALFTIAQMAVYAEEQCQEGSDKAQMSSSSSEQKPDANAKDQFESKDKK
jgi:hypothetical protein